MSKYLTEFIGAFFLVLVIGLTVIDPKGAGPMAPVAIGVILAVMIYAGGYRSGGHYNPAVTLAVWIRGKCETADVAPYMLAQFVGAVLAALTVSFLKQAPPAVGASEPMASVMLVEFLFTFALCYVVLGVATAAANAGNSFYGAAIGGTVLAAAYAAGPISGRAFNPAVALGAMLMGLATVQGMFLVMMANLLGGLVAGLAFRFLDKDSLVEAPPVAEVAPVRPAA